MRKNSRKRILIVVEGFFPPAVRVAGIRLVYEFVKQLSARYEIHVLTSVASWTQDIGSWEKELQGKWGVRLHTVHFRHLYFSPGRMVFSRLLLLVRAWRLARHFDYDIIQEFSSAPLLTYGSWLLRKLTGVRVYHCIATFNRSPLAGFGIHRLAPIDGTVFTSREFFEGFSANRNVSYRPLGVDVKNLGNWSQRHTALLEYHHQKEVIYLGPLESRKGIFVLGAVIKKMPAVNFKIYTYGAGGVDAKHRENRRRLGNILSGCENFQIFEGAFLPADVISSADFLLLPQTNLHGTIMPPLTLLEAMYLKRICLVSNVPGIREVVADGVDGFLFQSGDSMDLQRVLPRALALGHEEKKRIGEKARRKVSKDYNLENFVRSSISEYER